MELAERRAQLCEHDHRTSAGHSWTGVMSPHLRGRFQVTSKFYSETFQLRAAREPLRRRKATVSKWQDSSILQLAVLVSHSLKRNIQDTFNWLKTQNASIELTFIEGQTLSSTTVSSASVRKTTPRNDIGNDSKSFVAASEWRSDSISVNVYGMVCWCMLDLSQWTIMF